MKRESMVLLAFASLLILLPACKRKDGCGIFTCGKETKKIEKKKVAPMQEGMKKKAPAKAPAKAKKVVKK